MNTPKTYQERRAILLSELDLMSKKANQLIKEAKEIGVDLEFVQKKDNYSPKFFIEIRYQDQ